MANGNELVFRFENLERGDTVSYIYVLYVTLKKHPTKIQTNMTLPSYPTQFLAHCKAHKADTHKPTLQRAKNVNAQPTHPG